MDDVKFQIEASAIDVVLRFMVEVELNSLEHLARSCALIVEGDGGEGEGGLQVFVVGVIGNLSVFATSGAELEIEASLATLNIIVVNVDGRLLLSSLTIPAPLFLLVVILAQRQAHQAQ
jgi:hypothetical protein